MAPTRGIAVLFVALVFLAGAVGPAFAVADSGAGDRAGDVNHLHSRDGQPGQGDAHVSPGRCAGADASIATRDSPETAGGQGNAIETRAAAGSPSVAGPGPFDGPGPVAGADPVAGSSRPARQGASAIHERIVLAQDDERGYFRVTYEYDVPANLSELNVTVPFEYSFVEADGFGRFDGSKVRWTEDNDTTAPSVTFRVIADVGGRSGDFQFVDTGDWALIRTPERTLGWSGYGDVEVETTYDVDGEGAVGTEIAFLGPHEEYVAEADAETIRLVVPAAADLADAPGDVLDALTRASNELSVGAESEEVLFVAAPADDPDWLEWSALGIQRGDSDAWVRADAPLSSHTPTWLHEYVHTRQNFEPDTELETRWLVEAQADYYASLLALEFGYTSFEKFRSKLRLGRHASFDDVVLNERTTWQGTLGNYLKGALVVGRLDYEIRAATGGALTFQDVFRGMNERDGRIDHEAFVDLVGAVGGPSAARAADWYADTTATPVAWDRSAHEETFASAESPVVYRPAEFGVAGEYRESTLDDEPVLTAGENLTATVRVENTAEFNATFEVSMTVDGEAVATEWGILEPGETRTVTLSHAFEAPGEYEVAVLGERASVTVREPAGLTVTEVFLEPATVAPGESVTAVVTVTNPADVPGERVVEITVGGRTVHTERVALAPGETTTVETTFELDGSGSVTVVAGDASAELTVGETPSATPGFGVQTPGFTGGTAALAVGSLLVLAAVRRW